MTKEEALSHAKEHAKRLFYSESFVIISLYKEENAKITYYNDKPPHLSYLSDVLHKVVMDEISVRFTHKENKNTKHEVITPTSTDRAFPAFLLGCLFSMFVTIVIRGTH